MGSVSSPIRFPSTSSVTRSGRQVIVIVAQMPSSIAFPNPAWPPFMLLEVTSSHPCPLGMLMHINVWAAHGERDMNPMY